MTTASRALQRVLRQTPGSLTLRDIVTRGVASGPRQPFQQHARHGYATRSQGASNSSSEHQFLYHFSIAVGLLATSGVYFTARSTEAETPGKAQHQTTTVKERPRTPASRSQADYQAVYNAVAEKLIEESDWDDGSYGPILLRLGWHASGSYDAETSTGGSNGATMRFAPESDHEANSGLAHARAFLEPIKQQFPWITYSDLWILAAVCAVQEMGGPTVPWRPGRSDRDATWCTPDGRLPDASKSHDHLRAIFGRMGFDDQEIVALVGAHALGRCHVNRSGFDGPWTFSPITLTNDFYRLLLDENWKERSWSGPRQFQDGSKSLIMLPTDMAFVQDAAFKTHVKRYAADQEVFFEDFAKVLTKLFELGVPFETNGRMEFKRTE